jgi:excisionase family DNA binding protein
MAQNLLTVDQAATRLGVHRKTALRYIHDGRLKATRVGKAYRILPADLDSFAGLPVAGPKPSGARTTSIVEIPELSVHESGRIVTALQALLTSRTNHAESVRLQSAYDVVERQLKLVLIGGPGMVSSFMAFLGTLLEDQG